MENESRWGVPDWRDEDAYSSELTLSEWRWEFLRRRSDYRKDWDEYSSGSAFMPDCKQKYGIRRIQDPSGKTKNVSLMFIGGRSYGYSVGLASEQRFSELKDDGVMLIAFDLNKTLTPQLEYAKQYLTAVQKELQTKIPNTRKRIELWPRYLRVIDAVDSGASKQEIAKTLFPNKTNPHQEQDDVGDSLAAARVLMTNASGPIFWE